MNYDDGLILYKVIMKLLLYKLLYLGNNNDILLGNFFICNQILIIIMFYRIEPCELFIG